MKVMLVIMMMMTIATLWKCGQDVSPPIRVSAFSPQQPQSEHKASSIIAIIMIIIIVTVIIIVTIIMIIL